MSVLQNDQLLGIWGVAGVYLANIRGTHFFKIGETADIRSRVEQLDAVSPAPLDLVAFHPQPLSDWRRKEEQDALLITAHWRSHREWRLVATEDHADFFSRVSHALGDPFFAGPAFGLVEIAFRGRV